MPSAYRYALYLAPVGAWRELGRQWLGRCEDTGAPVPRAAGTDPRLDEWTRAPRRYGLHATLKAPFRLRHGQNAAALDRAVRAFAVQQEPFGIPLRRESLRGFLAWCIDDKHALSRTNALANAAVADLDAFRAPPEPAELARRQPQHLSPMQRQMLDRWGYPYVFETFTFHITLTGQLDDAAMREAQARLDALENSALQRPMPVNAVSLYVEPEPGADFVVARHYGFDGTTRDGAGARFLQTQDDAQYA
ncbi:Phosphonate metabolism protein [Bordetella tumbae]|uniref:DUF1045 domain-containing protein n=1 Tax=Bordetella tumbae TaxID=1649139 RepID=UPI0039F00197